MAKNQKVRRVLEWVGYCIGVVLFLGFSVFTWKAALGSLWMRETYLSAFLLPVYPLKIAIAVGMTMLFLQLVVDTARMAASGEASASPRLLAEAESGAQEDDR
jgi:TRAP-type C4-dicarboxylate transport system permease small subunit